MTAFALCSLLKAISKRDLALGAELIGEMVLGEMVWELLRGVGAPENCLFVPMPCGSVATLVPLEVW